MHGQSPCAHPRPNWWRGGQLTESGHGHRSPTNRLRSVTTTGRSQKRQANMSEVLTQVAESTDTDSATDVADAAAARKERNKALETLGRKAQQAGKAVGRSLVSVHEKCVE